MQIAWSKMIEQFGPRFGIGKAQIEDAYNKPDMTHTIGGNFISVKFYNGYGLLITFFMQGNKVHFMNAYKVFPDMVKVDPARCTALEFMVDFMNNFGMDVEIPGVGKAKIHVNEGNHEFFQGILDIEKYVAAAGDRVQPLSNPA